MEPYRHDTYHVYILRIKSCRTDYYTYSLVVRFDGLSPTDGGKITLVVELSDSRPITSSCPEDIFTSHVKKSLCCSVKTQTFFVVRKLTSLFCGTTWMVVKHVWTHVVLTKTVCSTIRFQPSYPDPSLKVFENLGILWHPEWSNTNYFIPTAEQFGTVCLHSQSLHTRVHEGYVRGRG